MCPEGGALSRSYYQVMIKCPQLCPRGAIGRDSVSERHWRNLPSRSSIREHNSCLDAIISGHI